MSEHKTPEAQTMGFQAEVKQLLHLMIHSLYSNKEIFLRELVSNAADACDKLRFLAIKNPELMASDNDLLIRVSFDAQARTITIDDNGIGMTYQEVIDNIGTIAKSGTKEFFSKLSGDQQKDAQLIGQFGVGFYSSFIVADNVVVQTRHASAAQDEGVEWQSAGEGEFSIRPINKAQRGTTIILHLREGEDELLNDWRLRSILRRYSDHISLPVQMPKVTETSDGEEQDVKDVTPEWETINQASALWTRNKADISDEQYIEFYKHISHDYEDPLCWTHNRVEGTSEYTQLLFIPKHPPFDMYDAHAKHGVQLYVKRVFIMDDAEQLMPNYLRFVKGVIDSADLPLNVSREILQESRDVRNIKEGSTKRVLSMLEDLANNKPEDYKVFWTQFGQVFKEGLGEDQRNQQRVAKLARFASTHNDTAQQEVSLEDYVSRMKEGQDKIYYVAADSFGAAQSSPHLEIFRKKGIEVLLLSDRVDEWALAYWQEFDGKPLVSISKGALDLDQLADAQEKEQQEKISEEAKPLLERLQKQLADKVKEVRVTLRLVDSPACVVVGEHELSPHLLRMLKAAGQETPELKPVLEINPEHAIIKQMQASSDEDFADWAEVILDQALLAEGANLENPAEFVKKMNRLLLNSHK
ncbi:molecular chaperone HtpG [Brackiella oedipodis]|uniref:molecular chaperone HtpG n=1 Tax=Brackiella oedipodis TaxID=124225 RepID=UPI00048CCDFD|nr:molecular chaperone HtpG [Brackiella oedipodis]